MKHSAKAGLGGAAGAAILEPLGKIVGFDGALGAGMRGQFAKADLCEAAGAAILETL